MNLIKSRYSKNLLIVFLQLQTKPYFSQLRNWSNKKKKPICIVYEKLPNSTNKTITKWQKYFFWPCPGFLFLYTIFYIIDSVNKKKSFGYTIKRSCKSKNLARASNNNKNILILTLFVAWKLYFMLKRA